jgi:hypothetical protein
MKQDKDTGAFHFSGDEDEVAMRWLSSPYRYQILS